MLFDPARHEQPNGAAWDAGRAHEAIRAIVRDIEASRLPAGHWPAHPLDADEGAPATGCKSLYLGSAGTAWALWCLQRTGAVTLVDDPADGMARIHADYLADPDTSQVVPSYLLGEAGILLVQWRITGSADAADALHAVVHANIANPTNESLWAAPGTMVAAWHLWVATGEDRWRTLFLDNVEQLWSSWLFDEQAQCHLWIQDMYGRVAQFLGAGHGFAGNVYPLLTGAALLDADRRETLFDRCVATAGAFAQREGDAVNWRPRTSEPRPGSPRMMMQWCHGAPGFLTALSDFPAGRSADMEAMLIGAGHAVWQAGPLTKGHGLCHGTAGNGYALLKLYRRTGDPLWLERARVFAMHASGQMERMRLQHGQGRYSLWTGDPGLAVFLWHCIVGEAAMPALDALV